MYIEISQELVGKQTENMKKLIKNKLRMIVNEAIKEGEHELVEVLRDINDQNIETIKQELEEKGYVLEIKGNVAKNKVELRVKKVIYEV